MIFHGEVHQVQTILQRKYSVTAINGIHNSIKSESVIIDLIVTFLDIEIQYEKHHSHEKDYKEKQVYDFPYVPQKFEKASKHHSGVELMIDKEEQSENMIELFIENIAGVKKTENDVEYV